MGSQLKLSQTSPTVLTWVFLFVTNDSPTIAKIWDTSGNKKRFLFFRFFPGHPRLSGKSIICVFHYSAKSGTVGKLRNPRSSEIFPIYDNWAKWKYLGKDDFSVTPSVKSCQIWALPGGCFWEEINSSCKTSAGSDPPPLTPKKIYWVNLDPTEHTVCQLYTCGARKLISYLSWW